MLETQRRAYLLVEADGYPDAALRDNLNWDDVGEMLEGAIAAAVEASRCISGRPYPVPPMERGQYARLKVVIDPLDRDAPLADQMKYLREVAAVIRRDHSECDHWLVVELTLSETV